MTDDIFSMARPSDDDLVTAIRDAVKSANSALWEARARGLTIDASAVEREPGVMVFAVKSAYRNLVKA